LAGSSFTLKVRVVQMTFVGLFCLGVSWALCDIAAIYRELLPISPASVGMMSYGAMGAVFMEVVARRMGKVRESKAAKGTMLGMLTLTFVIVISAAAVVFPYSFVGVQFSQWSGAGREYVPMRSAEVALLSEPYQVLPLFILVASVITFLYLALRKRSVQTV